MGFILSVSSFMFLGGLGMIGFGAVSPEQLIALDVPEAVIRLNLLLPGLLVIVTGILGLVMLLPAARVRVIRALRLDLEADNVVHLVALVFAVWLAGLTLMSLLVFIQFSVEELTEGDGGVTIAQLWEQGIAFTLFALLGVGFGLRRSLADTLERLGVTRVTPRQIGIVFGAIVVLTVFDALVSTAWRAFAPGSYERIAEISGSLFSGVIGPLGAISIGLTAGIGEELLFRGALQPRFGLVLTTVLFTLGHTQYEISPALFSVFVIGLVLGVVRQRENTTTAILIHAGYNALNVFLAPLWS